MTPEAPEQALIGPSDIARMADVSPALVTNWKKTQRDFPPAAGTGPRGDLYDPNAVMAWLINTGRIPRERDAAAQMWQLAGLVRNYVDRADYAAVVLTAMTPDGELPNRLQGSIPAAAWRQLQDKATSIANLMGAASAARELTDLLGSTDRMGESLGGPIHQVVAALARPVRGIVFDMAVGTGDLLATTVDQLQGLAAVNLVGADRNQSMADRAAARLALAGHDVRMETGDVLVSDPFPQVAADVIVSIPPMGEASMTNPYEPTLLRMAGLPVGTGSSQSSKLGEAAWLFYAAAHLKPDGRGVVVTSPGAVRLRYRDSVRELLRIGGVEALISLPGGLASNTHLPFLVWMLRSPFASPRRTHVTFVDGTRPEFDWVNLPEQAAQLVNDEIKFLAAADPVERSDVAASVSILDLLGKETTLDPQQWVNVQRLRYDPSEAQAEIDLALQDLDQALTVMPDDVPASYDEFALHGLPTTITIDELRRAGQLSLTRGVNINTDDLNDDKNGLPVITVKGVDNLVATATGHTKNYPANVQLTEPGTVVLMPAGGKIRAGVDQVGGSILARPLIGINLTDNTTLTPLILATILSGDRVKALATGAAMQRIAPGDVTLPRLDPVTAARLDTILRDTHAIIERSEKIADAGRWLMRHLEAGIWAGFMPTGDPARRGR